MTIAFEAVPRNREDLVSAARSAAKFPQIRIINVPDLIRFPIRSWEACGILVEALGAASAGAAGTGAVPAAPAAAVPAETGAAAPETAPAGVAFMPHLRARDFDPGRPFPRIAFFRSLGIDRVLVIAGEGAEDDRTEGFTIPFIRKLKAEMPGLSIYAAFDPYRSNIRYELDYLKAKEDAGADGFFSQPFFDLRLLEIYAEYLEGKNVFWGLSPVLTGKNRNYWELRNRAVFPKSFKPDLAWNAGFGRRVLDFCKERSFNIYLMPIKMDTEAYLSELLGQPQVPPPHFSVP
jgi:methylenetetrahydrofolate reductase (NADPH)